MNLSIQERLKDLRVERGSDAGTACGANAPLQVRSRAVMRGTSIKDISHYALIELAKFYGVTADYLLGR